MAKLFEAISPQQLIDGGVEFEVQLEDPEEELPDEDIEKELLKFTNMSVLQDENDYVEGEPFEIIAKRMTDLIADGGVKKIIIREGHGETPPDLAVVRVDYNAYIEYEPQPFDSTYSRKKKQEFVINNSEVIMGLDIAVQSMKLTEKSQFLIKPDYAYGSLGCLSRVPENSTVLFEIELHEIIDSGAATSFNKLPEEKKSDFQEVYKHCLSLCTRAKDKINRNNYRDAVKDYNLAVSRIEQVEMKNYEEQEKQQDLLLRLYSNILICCTALQDPNRGCRAANRIFEMTKGTGIKVAAKVYYNNAKCLRMLGNFSHAKRKLECARRMEPHNPDIANEFMVLQQQEEKYKQKDSQMAKAFVGNLQ